MVHYTIGFLGHFLVIVAFISAILAAFGFFKASEDEKGWIRFSEINFYIHSAAIVGILVVLFSIINLKYFEYHYAWNYSSKYLPIYYQISSFWNGQEGAFLLWMFWNVLLGLVLLRTNKYWKPSVMTVMSVNQVFLASMILGVVLFSLKIGSSPFMLLRDVIQDNIFKINPEFVPADGNGLNPLLQNYWMVIHPPTLFLGFASTIVPFAFAIAGIWKGKFTDWIRPALPWAQFSAVVLGVGILMGAYWAYETLNFGGYWNWDPVENAIFVPWLTLVAAMHTMIAYKKSGNALKLSFVLVAATYLLILYSTFLTRSGILGESSVHSFTDLGLSGQLLLFLIFFLISTIVLFSTKWKLLPDSEKDVSTYSREFWIFMGATTLCLMAFQVIIPTSIPVWNEIASFLGLSGNWAPPAEPVEFYSKYQLWFAVGVAILSGTGQFFWWKKMDREKLITEIKTPITIALLISAAIIFVAKVNQVPFMVLLVTSVYSIVANSKILLGLKRTNLKLSGGSVTHIGIALMLIGILFSSGYSTIISKNNTGLLWSKEFPDDMNQDNLLLFLNEPRQMGDYSLLYKGIRKKVKEHGFINADFLQSTEEPLELRVKKEIPEHNLSVGDIVRITNPENSYFEVEYKKSNGDVFTLFPRIQINELMGTLSSPDINRTLKADLYTHISNLPDPEQDAEWSDMQEMRIKIGEQFFVNDYAAKFEEMERLSEVPGITLGSEDVAVKARIRISAENQDFFAEPIYVIKDQMAGRLPSEIREVASRLTIMSIHPEDDSFTFGINTTQKDWIILEAVEKPWINILWTGTLLLVIGFVIAIVRRYQEFVTTRDKGME